jgi:DNA-binding MurR/RpiR family transcriptional regulator
MVSPSTSGVGGTRTTVLARLATLARELRETERKIADYVLAHPAEIVHLSITELADVTETSEASVIRFARRLGFPGYAALKINLALELERQGSPLASDLGSGTDVGTIKRRILQANVDSLNDAAQLLDDEAIARAVEAMTRARRIEVFGVGSSGALAQEAYATFVQHGLAIHAVVDPHLQVISAVHLGPGDVAFGISASGSTRDTVEALECAHEVGATCICLTRYARSPITRIADITLIAPARAATVGGHQLVGRVAQLAVIDVLAAAIALDHQRNGLQPLDRSRRAVHSRKRY